jgi:hypothetical protein
LVFNPFEVPETARTYTHIGFPGLPEIIEIDALSFSTESRVHFTIPVDAFSFQLKSPGSISAKPASPKSLNIDSVSKRRKVSSGTTVSARALTRRYLEGLLGIAFHLYKFHAYCDVFGA